MSHAHGEVRIGDTVVGYFEYNGTADITTTAIQKTREDVRSCWRSPDNMRKCTCNKPSVKVTLYADYGSGIEFESKACLDCGAITGPTSDDT